MVKQSWLSWGGALGAHEAHPGLYRGAGAAHAPQLQADLKGTGGAAVGLALILYELVRQVVPAVAALFAMGIHTYIVCYREAKGYCTLWLIAIPCPRASVNLLSYLTGRCVQKNGETGYSQLRTEADALSVHHRRRGIGVDEVSGG